MVLTPGADDSVGQPARDPGSQSLRVFGSPGECPAREGGFRTRLLAMVEQGGAPEERPLGQ